MSGQAPRAVHAFAALEPDVVLDALASVGLLGDGRLMALNSYENRVFLAHLDRPLETGAAAPVQAVVAKFYRPGRWSQDQIAEEHAFSLELLENEVPVVAPLRLDGQTLHQHAGFFFSVSPYRGGRAPELDDEEVLEWVGRFLARLHAVGARSPFVHRPALDLQSFGLEPRSWLLENDFLPLDVRSAWEQKSAVAIDLIASCADLTAGNGQKDPESAGLRRLRLHGDCHPGNILWTPLDAAQSAGPGPHFVDLDDARTGCAVQDLWMLVSGERAQRQRQLGLLVDGYEQFREFDRRELALIEPLRTLRLIHYSAWLARRWDDPSFQRHFPWFGSSDYWQGQVQMLEDQIEAMQEEPLIV
ncbi:MAG: serine/threonine protein kinase [Rhodoferax sp.]|nr:MAG: serine/threonine protein kinase [Rhodoferax sp.]